MTKAQFKKWFPKQLKECREFAGLTQGEVAKDCGLTQDWISHFEGGRRLPNAVALFRLNKLFPTLLKP
jgi:transcriptional regulator with XRE-family HTH domain